MNKETKDVFDKIKNEVIYCHYHWQTYRQLFGTNESRIKIMNDTTPSVFLILQDLFMDNITLAISKLIDHAETKGNKNLSLYLLLDLLENEIDVSSREKLIALIEQLKGIIKIFRDRRNKLIAHLDLKTAIGVKVEDKYLISRKNVEDALAIISKFLNEIELYFFDGESMYDEIIGFIGDDGTSLLINMAKAIAYDELVNQKIITENLWQKYGQV